MILGPPLLGSLERRRSSGAEQLSCKQQVVGSNPTAGSANPQVRCHVVETHLAWEPGGATSRAR
jgi:hypothetical protein